MFWCVKDTSIVTHTALAHSALNSANAATCTAMRETLGVGFWLGAIHILKVYVG